jgi:hypothetical protein
MDFGLPFYKKGGFFCKKRQFSLISSKNTKESTLHFCKVYHKIILVYSLLFLFMRTPMVEKKEMVAPRHRSFEVNSFYVFFDSGERK